jgi:hypothetical protein
LSSQKTASLAEITTYLIDRDRGRSIDHPDSAAFYDTLRNIFTNDLTQDQFDQAAQPDYPGSFDALAAERRRILAHNDDTASGIHSIRDAWHRPPVNADEPAQVKH